MTYRTGWGVVLAGTAACVCSAQRTAPSPVPQGVLPVKHAGELMALLDRLQVVGSVLYIGAHPDDENTSLISAFARGRHLRTAYLSLTRGDGGQNLIGPELGDALGVIRTQELLAARRVDGGEQFFTRAVDFGYSKTPEETFRIWGKEPVLADMVWLIRTFQPDLIISRFATDGSGGHGHHTAGAMLTVEAFHAAADPKRFPEQLQQTAPWQATRALWNVFRWGDATLRPDEATVEVGGYAPLLTRSFGELSAEARSMHRSQGFGMLPSRGSRMDAFQLMAGRPLKDDIFEGIDLSWGRIPGSDALRALLAQARQGFRPDQPDAILPLLLQARQEMSRLQDPRVAVKRLELDEAIRASAGLWIEAMADRQAVAAGDKLVVNASALKRSSAEIRLEAIQLRGAVTSQADKAQPLPFNRPVQHAFTATLPGDTPHTGPYWLQGPRPSGLYPAPSLAATGLAENPPALEAVFRFTFRSQPFELACPVQHRFRDPALGERVQPLMVLPPVMVNLAEGVQVFGSDAPRDVELTVVAGLPNASGTLHLQMPDGWKAEPSQLPFRLEKPFDEMKVRTRVTPPTRAAACTLRVEAEVGGKRWPALGLQRISYPHIPLQTLLPPAEERLVRVDLKHNGRRIGYVMGAGDEIPQCLRPLGYDVELLSDEALATSDLGKYDAIVVGIRAFNTRPRLAQLQKRLLQYVERGGTQVVQYAVSNGLVTQDLGPYPFKVGRERVTDENAPMKVLQPEHPALNWPNKLGPADFEGWVQERGLYFAESWDPRYVPIFASADPGERDHQGALLVAKHGKGHFVYTGLAFFRQLPDGVPGAYRLFANLISLSKAPK